jgi:hypothetical protein
MNPKSPSALINLVFTDTVPKITREAVGDKETVSTAKLHPSFSDLFFLLHIKCLPRE